MDDGGGLSATIDVCHKHTDPTLRPVDILYKQNNAAPLTAGLCAYECVHFVLRRCFLQPRYISFDYICTDSSEEVGSVGCGFIFAFDLFFLFFFSFLVFEYTLLCVLPCVHLYENVCACMLAGLCGCAQTTLCVNSSLAVGGQTPRVCVCVCVD